MELLANIITWLGILSLFKLSLKAVPKLYNFVRWIIGSGQIDLKSYGEWAVITGSTDGIGKAYANELARRGMNIILISRSEEKLRSTAKEMEQEHAVKTSYIQADFTRRDCYDHIKQFIEGKDIGILVNNVGMAEGIYLGYWSIDETIIWEELNVNCGAALIMTRIILPHMVSKRKGLIVNMSSITADFPLPFTGIYCATKAFLNMFSISLQAEVERHNIKVQCLIPSFIETKLLTPGKNLMVILKKFLGIFIPDPKTYAKSAINSLNENSVIATGYWPHTVKIYCFTWLPWKIRAYLGCFLVELAGSYTENKSALSTKNK